MRNNPQRSEDVSNRNFAVSGIIAALSEARTYMHQNQKKNQKKIFLAQLEFFFQKLKFARLIFS
jgi:hypothetical protein